MISTNANQKLVQLLLNQKIYIIMWHVQARVVQGKTKTKENIQTVHIKHLQRNIQPKLRNDWDGAAHT